MNAGQQVTPADAAALAEALERAVRAADFVESARRLTDELHDEVVRQYPKARGELKPLSREDAEKFRRRLSELAALAGQGPFVIE